jgi:hypothetical protein
LAELLRSPMKTKQTILAGVVCLSIAAYAWADMSDSPWSANRTHSPCALRPPSDLASPANPTGLQGDDPWYHVEADVCSVVADAAERSAKTHPPNIRALPPPPGSSTLLLCGLGSLGAWQLTRSVRRLSLSAVPDWFYTGGPNQIGHAVLIDLDASTLPMCCLDRPVEPQTDSKHCGWQDDEPSCWDAQFVPAVSAPRGPPNCSR